MEEASILELAHRAIENGHRAEAVGYFIEAIKINPRRLSTWLDLEASLDDPKKKKQCLTYVLNANPTNVAALERMRQLENGSACAEMPEIAHNAPPIAAKVDSNATQSKPEPKVITCPSCHNQVFAGETRCRYCGVPLTATGGYSPTASMPSIPAQPAPVTNNAAYARSVGISPRNDQRINYFPGEETAVFQTVDLSYAPVSTHKVDVAAHYEKEMRAEKRKMTLKTCLIIFMLIGSLFVSIVYLISRF